MLREMAVRADSRIQRSPGFDEKVDHPPSMAVADSPGLVWKNADQGLTGYIKAGRMFLGDSRPTKVNEASPRLLVSDALPMDKPVDNLGTNSFKW
jgi:hypothetical protein